MAVLTDPWLDAARLGRGLSHTLQLTEEDLCEVKSKIELQLQSIRKVEIENLRKSQIRKIDEEKFEEYTSTIEKWETGSTTIEQCPSNISFVFRLWNSDKKTSLILKSFSRPTSAATLSKTESRLKLCAPMNHSLLSKYTLMVSSAYFFVFEGLHPISREKAKSCFIEFLLSVKVAIDELHKLNAAHLDIRLPNICLKKQSGRCTAVLIDLEHCAFGIDNLWSGECNSCMYREYWSLEQIDYLQVYWMAFWIMTHPAGNFDYHKMHLLKTNEFSVLDPVCITIFTFINTLHDDFSPEESWKSFMDIVNSSSSSSASSLDCE